MQQIRHESKSGSSLYPELDRVQMSRSDRTRAKAQMLRAEFIAELVLKAAKGLKEALGQVVKPLQNWLAKSKTRAG